MFTEKEVAIVKALLQEEIADSNSLLGVNLNAVEIVVDGYRCSLTRIVGKLNILQKQYQVC